MRTHLKNTFVARFLNCEKIGSSRGSKPRGLAIASSQRMQTEHDPSCRKLENAAEDIFEMSSSEQGFVLVWWALAMPLILVVIAGVMLFSLSLNLRTRLDYRCRDEALGAQETLAQKLIDMTALNKRIALVHQTYRSLQLGQVLPPTAPFAHLGLQALRALKIALNVAQDSLHFEIRRLLLTRSGQAESQLTKSVRADFQPRGASLVNLSPKPVRFRLFQIKRLDQISKILEPVENISEQTQLHWQWRLSPHNLVPEQTLGFLRRALSLKKIVERRRANGGLHLIRGECSSYLASTHILAKSGGGKLWNVYLGQAPKPMNMVKR